MSHTPGKWKSMGYEITDSQNRPIAVCDYAWQALKTKYANASLIASAPELLEACKCALSTGVLEHGGVGNMLRQAIAKAEGKE